MEHAPELGAAVAARLRGFELVGITGGRILPAAAMDALRGGVRAVTDASALTTELRMVKSPAELALLTQAARISDLGVRAGLEAVADGAREVEMAAAAEHAIRSAGAELSFTTVAGAGPRTGLGTFLPGDRRMRAGEAVLLDCGARVHGYHGDMCRTVAVGEPPPELEQALEAVAAAVEAAIDAARPGVTVGDLRESARGAVVEAGLVEAWWGEFMPHGAGTGQHEPPYGDRDPACELWRGHGALHRAGRPPAGHRRRRARADDRGHRRRRERAEPAAASHVALTRAGETWGPGPSVSRMKHRDHVRVFQSGWTL